MQKENGMSKRIRAASHAASLTLRLVLLGSFAMTTPLFSQSSTAMDHSEQRKHRRSLSRPYGRPRKSTAMSTPLSMPGIIPSLAVSRGPIMAPWGCTT